MGNACYKPDEDKVELDLRDFRLDVVVGKGAFGKVKKVRHLASKKDYALKYIEKDLAIKKKAVLNIFEERKLLEQLNNPFIINLRYAFQDDQNMFFVLDIAEGGDLRYHLLRVPDLPDDTLQCYMAEISLALEYLHAEKVIHRDIKPDNLIIDSKGHIHLCDFNVSFKVTNDKLPTRRAGTMVYMAPEMFTSTPYEYSVDYFATGVTIYECVWKVRPFQGNTEEELIASISTGELLFPTCVIPTKKKEKPKTREVTDDFKSFLTGLMVKDPTQRLGYQAEGLAKLRAHPWMKSINWETAKKKELKPSFSPDPNERNFDGIHYLEEVFVDEQQLHYKPRKKGTSPAAEKPDLKQGELTEGLPTEVQQQMDFIDRNFKCFNWMTRTGALDALPPADENSAPPAVEGIPGSTPAAAAEPAPSQ